MAPKSVSNKCYKHYFILSALLNVKKDHFARNFSEIGKDVVRSPKTIFISNEKLDIARFSSYNIVTIRPKYHRRRATIQNFRSHLVFRGEIVGWICLKISSNFLCAADKIRWNFQTASWSNFSVKIMMAEILKRLTHWKKNTLDLESRL